MQRYRVNYGLLIGLLVGLVVVGVAGYFILDVQLNRNAEQLLRRAEAAEQEGDTRKVAGFLRNYSRLRPKEVEVAERMANAYIDIIYLPDTELQKDYSRAITVTEAVVRQHGEQVPELRKRLARLYILGRQWVSALNHIDVLVNADAKDQELQLMRVSCLLQAKQNKKALDYMAKLVGLDLSKGAFNSESASSPDAVDLYPRLARLVRELENDEPLSDQIINQMVEVNPESAKALILRSQHLLLARDEEAADKDLAKAIEMAPVDAQVLLANAIRKRQLEDYPAARLLLETLIKEHPQNYLGYRERAVVELLETNDLKQATAFIEQGIQNVGAGPARSLLFDKARLQADGRDKAGLQESINELKKVGALAAHQLSFLEGRLLFLNREWFKAAEKLESIRTLVSTNSDMGGPTNFYLGAAYEQLGQYDLAAKAYKTATDLQPSNSKATLGEQRVRGKLRLNASGGSQGIGLTAIINAELDKPEAKQDWQALDDKVVKYVDQLNLQPFMLPVLRADIAAKRKRFDEARQIIQQAQAEYPDVPAIDRIDILVTAQDEARGPAEALKKFDQTIAPKYPNSAGMRLLKADLLVAVDDENVSAQLTSLTEGLNDWETADKVRLFKGLARKFTQVRDNESRLWCLNQVSQLAPSELSTLLELFQAALATGDNDAMQQAQDNILKAVGSKENENWLFAEASRLTTQAGTPPDMEMLARANDLIDRAIGKREDWHMLYLARSSIASARGDRAASLAALDKANELGPLTPGGVIQYVGLLAQAGRYKDALQVLEKASTTIRERVLVRQHAEILLNLGKVAEARDKAQAVIDLNQENAGLQLWYSRLLRRIAATPTMSESERSTLLDDAIAALEKALAIMPDSADAWLDLAITNTANKKRLAAENALHRAQLALPIDQSTPILARGYELIGRFLDAENLYRTLLAQRPNDLGIKRQLATFYLSNRYPREDKLVKATGLINKILAAAEKPDEYVNLRQTKAAIEQHVRWARQSAAEQLSRTNDYQNLLQAERLLLANVVDGQFPRADRLLMAQILAPRPEPGSRLRAIRLLEDLRNEQQLPVRIEQTLGQLYFVTDDWNAARTQMIDTIARAPDQPALRAAYIRMLLQRGDKRSLDESARQLKKLRELAPTNVTTLELVARVFTKFGKEQEALKVLAQLLRSPQANGATYLGIARLMAELGSVKEAEQIYQRLAEQSPDARLQYVLFIGQYLDPEQAFAKLEEMRREVDATKIAGVATSIVRARRDEIGDSLVSQAQQWLDRGLRDDPESTSLLLMQAELFDLQKKYEEAIAVYSNILEQGDFNKQTRALILNNLAYLSATSSSDTINPEKAMGFVAEAADILGPTADILDTRAVTFLALDKPKEAIEDLKLSLIDSPTASKYFHLSLAYLQSGNLKEMVTSWDKAVKLDLKREDVASAEKDKFDALESKVKEVRGG